jgi:hypothetical protein
MTQYKVTLQFLDGAHVSYTIASELNLSDYSARATQYYDTGRLSYILVEQLTW